MTNYVESARGFGTGAGYPRKYESEDLIQEFADYCEIIDDNPLMEAKVFQNQGEVIEAEVPKKRPYTLKGFCIHLGVTFSAFQLWERSRDDLQEVLEFIRQCVYNQKYENAAAGFFNSNIVARDLGLSDKQETIVTPAAPKVDDILVADKVHPDCTDEQLAAIYAAGLEPMLYSQQQIDMGVPWIMPPLDDEA